MIGLDFRPATGQLFALGNAPVNIYRLYTINTATGVATQVGSDISSFSGATFFGFDFNPVPDRIRIVNDNEQNVRANPTNAAITLDGPLAFAAADANAAANPNVVGSAYANSFAGATATTLYGLDTNLDILVTQNPPNDGTLNTVGQLGANFSGRSSFDISAATTTAYATTVTGIATPLAPNGEVLQATQLYRINLGNGAATLIGSFPPGIVVNAISVPTPEAPGTKFGNISTRVGLGTADNVSIAGFIITGNEPKRVLVRGIGPSLATLGISSPVADPLLQLYNSDNVVIATNDNWKETQEGEIRATNIPPQNDLESAIIRTLEPGRYTAVERSKDGTDNIGLVEVFDVNPASDSQLSNLSTRGFVGTQERVMIGGLIIAGTDPVRVVVRAIGPSMTTVTGTLADPTLELFDANGVSLAFNDDWRDTQESELMQTELAPTNNKESAIVRNLAPSRYTAIVRGKNGTTGVALVEFNRAAEQPN